MSHYLENGKKIISTLNDNGFEAYFVGGFVRDHLLGIESDDIDITTDATPEQVESLFPFVKHTGRKFGGVTVFIEKHAYEVTTYRLEAEYQNHRHPGEVTFSSNLKDDLVRRDFTINALVMDADERIFDHVDGTTDLEARLIRTIGDPRARFEEDALRILRAFRFVSKLDFAIESQTLAALKEHRHLVQTITIERVMVELDKILSAPHQKRALRYLLETRVADELYGIKRGIEHVVAITDHVQPLEFFMIAFILDDIDDIWRFSNRDMRLIMQVINLHEVTKDDAFNKHILFSNKLEPCLIANRINVMLGHADQEPAIRVMWDDMAVHDVCDLAFKGQDILELTTLKRRSTIGLVIDDLLEAVLTGATPNEYDPLKQLALDRIQQLQSEMRETNE